MRDLASIVTVENVIPMEGKDRIVCVTFKENGYECIIPKEQAVSGNLICFIQEGAVLPVKPQWEFLRKRCYRDNLMGKEGFLIKPMVMGKKEDGTRVKSWGLGIPLNELGLDEAIWKKFKAGDNIEDKLEIWKYEPEEDASPRVSSKKAYPKWVKFCLSHLLTRWIGCIWQKRHQNSGGGFPTELISKSDETTLQNMKWVLEKFADQKVNITAKIEGQSGTVIPTFKGKKMTGAYVCSRNNAYKLEDKSLFWDMMRKYNIVKKMKEWYKATGEAFIIQFEQAGPTIQNNIYDFKQNKWFVYEVKNYFTLEQGSYIEQVRVADIFGLEVVPLLWTGTLKEVMPDIDSAVAFAEKAVWVPEDEDKTRSWLNLENKGKLWKDYMQHEGVVVRTEDYDKDNNIGVSFKIKNLQYQEHGLGKIHQDCIDYKNSRK